VRVKIYICFLLRYTIAVSCKPELNSLYAIYIILFFCFMRRDYFYNQTRVLFICSFLFFKKLNRIKIKHFFVFIKNDWKVCTIIIIFPCEYVYIYYIYVSFFHIHFTPDYIEMLTNRFVRAARALLWHDKKHFWWIAKHIILTKYFSWSLTIIRFGNFHWNYNTFFFFFFCVYQTRILNIILIAFLMNLWNQSTFIRT